MASLRSTYGLSLATANEWGYVVGTNASWAGSAGAVPPPFIYCHASTGSAQQVVDDIYQINLVRKLAQYYTVYVGDFGLEAWGNDTHIARIEAARTYLSTTFGSTGLVSLFGISMGGLGVTNYVRANPANVRSAVLCIPALDIVDMYNNRGFASVITGAYPGADAGGISNATIASHNPVQFASSMNQTIPMLLMHSSADTTCVPATADAFVQGRPRTKRYELGAIPHSTQAAETGMEQAVSFSLNLI